MKKELLALLTKENAMAYKAVEDKLVFCSDLTGLSVDDLMLERFEDELEELADSL